MQGFWKLTTVVIALTGFLITGGLLLSKGEAVAEIIWKSIAVFAVLQIVGNFLGGILLSVVNSSQPTNNQNQGPKK